ncbi:hypothetical protein P7K49_010664 [Saguinus oedipus]|uniref:C-type lectin domain-containing protein n=1 Tax=Saguinus oedipus TaxID=9490 RepID=A0ABQ9VQT3_SAGOE|nr:hypothetical protein P7K49_010664 [Saguinus oedipus]
MCAQVRKRGGPRGQGWSWSWEPGFPNRFRLPREQRKAGGSEQGPWEPRCELLSPGVLAPCAPTDQPDNPSEENCGVIRTESSGGWQNRDCSIALPYVCKKKPNATAEPAPPALPGLLEQWERAFPPG